MPRKCHQHCRIGYLGGCQTDKRSEMPGALSQCVASHTRYFEGLFVRSGFALQCDIFAFHVFDKTSPGSV
eukprot:4200825-Amphidinium_carterae.1